MTRPTNKLLEVKLLVDKWVIEETLSRIGIVDYKKKIIYQSCHLFEQFGTYYLAHFKQLFIISTDKSGYHGFGNVSLEDIERRNRIAFLLAQWNMIKIVNPEEIEPHNMKVEIVKHADADKFIKVKKFHTSNLINSFD